MSSVKAAIASCSEIEEEEEEEEEEESSRDLFEIDSNGIIIGRRRRSLTPVKEDQYCSYDDESSCSSDLFSFEVGPNGENVHNSVVYVGVWRSSSTNKIDHHHDQISMDALLWTLKNLILVPAAIHPPPPAGPGRGNHLSSSSSSATTSAAAAATTTTVYLIHVFPELRHIPTPLGKLPLSQANPEQKESFMIQERIKRRDFLQKFLDLCSASKVRVETILIESDMEAKAILDLIPILNIRRLVLGTSKSSLRKMRSKRGSGTLDQILQKAPDFCEVKVICEGKEVFEDQLIVESPTPSPRAIVSSSPRPTPPPQDHITDTFTCGCFKPKVVS